MDFFVSCKIWKDYKGNSDLGQNRKSMKWAKGVAVSTSVQQQNNKPKQKKM